MPSPNNHSNEERVARLLRANNIEFERNKSISYNCVDSTNIRRASLDFVVPTDRALFIVEVDESICDDNEQSSTVLNDLGRMLGVETTFMTTADPAIGKQLTVWIRYNPGAFCVDGVNAPTSKRDREATLLRVLRHYVPERPTTIMYLYYACSSDSNNEWGRPTILDDEDYNHNVAALVDIMTKRQLDALGA